MFRFNLWPRPFIHPGAPQGLEGSPFFTNPLTMPPSLAFAAGSVDSTAKNALQDKDKDGFKETMIPFSSALPLFRPGETLPPAALYSPIHQQFLRAQIELAHAHNREQQLHAHSSAFAPAKRARTGEVRRSTSPPNIERSFGTESASPSRRERAQSRDAETLHSPGSHVSRTSTPRDLDDSEERRSNAPSEPISSPGAHSNEGGNGLHCPVCRCTLNGNEELNSHIAQEMHELRMFASHRSRDVVSRDGTSRDMNGMPARSRYETFMRIRNNRENRLAKLRGVRRKRALEDDSFISVNGHDESFISKEEEEHIDIISCDDNANAESPSNRKSIASADPLCCTGCMTSFTKVVPVTSTKCWHVRCESCWNENNEQCPQCKIHLNSEDLRRIYL